MAIIEIDGQVKQNIVPPPVYWPYLAPQESAAEAETGIPGFVPSEAPPAPAPAPTPAPAPKAEAPKDGVAK